MVSALAAKLQQHMLNLLAKAYSCISLQTAQALTGLNAQDVTPGTALLGHQGHACILENPVIMQPAELDMLHMKAVHELNLTWHGYEIFLTGAAMPTSTCSIAS